MFKKRAPYQFSYRLGAKFDHCVVQWYVGEYLGDRTVAALRSIGAQIDLRQTPNRSQAIIGVKGAVAGTAIEHSIDGEVFISFGRNADERSLSAAVSVITLEKNRSIHQLGMYLTTLETKDIVAAFCLGNQTDSKIG